MTIAKTFWHRASIFAGATVSLTFLSVLARPTAQAATITLDFEGLQNLEPIGNFYNGGAGGFGSTGGQNFGIQFSDNSLAIIDEDAGGTGNFGGEPSPDTIAFFLTGESAVMDVADGFDTGFSFFYSAVNRPGTVNVYDNVGGTGDILASIDLPLTPFEEAADPTGQFSPLLPFGVNFDGIARSVDFGGTIDRIGFDNITLGSQTPMPGPTPPPANPNPTPPPIDPDPMPMPTPMPPATPTPMPPTDNPPSTRIPEPSATTALLLGLMGMGSTLLKRHRKSA